MVKDEEYYALFALRAGEAVKDFYDMLPDFLAAADLRETAGRVTEARKNGKYMMENMK